jgi:dephospho-CoA kinase
MLKVALTGGIATGKSYVLEQFQRRGVACLDADLLAHGVAGPGTEATAAIAARFGPDILSADGAVDRAKLGAMVFADPSARRDLEAIVHPGVYRAIAAGVRAFELVGGDPFVLVDVPLLYETGAEKDFDKVIVTACTVEKQIARLVARGLTDTAARQRLAAQWPTEKKTARADFVINTDGSLDETNAQVDEIYRLLVASC